MTTANSSTRRNRISSAAVLSAALCLGLGFSAASVTAQSVATVPVGAVGVSIAAGTGTTRTISVVSFPLLLDAGVTGQATGRITGVSANSISNSAAGWTAGQISSAPAPCIIQITSGAAVGRTFLVSTSTANSGDTVTIDSEEAGLVDLTTLGISTGASGDTYKIVACDTISSVFGTPELTGILGGANSTVSDNIRLFIGGGWREYYYNTTSNAWLRIGPNTNSNNVPVRPDSLVVYTRLGDTPINLTFTGSVPSIARKAIVRNSGVSAVATGFPVDMTLAALSLNSVPGWVSGATSTQSDIVRVFVQGGWREYFYNGTNWLRVGPNTVSNTVVVPAGSGLIINRLGSATGATAYSKELPYSL